MAEYDLGKVQGDDGVGIASVEQTTKSTESGGTNVITVTKTDGTSSTFEVMNGTAGKDVTVIDNLTKSSYTEGEALSAHQGYVLDDKIKNYGTDVISDCDSPDHTICWTNSSTLNTPYKAGVTEAARGKLITENLDSENSYNCQLLMAGGEYLYTRRKTTSGWAEWEQLIKSSNLLAYGTDNMSDCNYPTSILASFNSSTLNSPYTESLTTATTGIVLSSLLNSSSSRCVQFTVVNTVNMSKFVFTRYKTDASTWTEWKTVSLTLS